MTLQEIYNRMEQEVSGSLEGQLTLRRSEPEIYPGLNAFMESFGRDEFVISGCALSYTDDFVNCITVSGTGTLFQEAQNASVELEVNYKSFSGQFHTSAFITYDREMILRLADICALPATPWSSGSLLEYRDSVMAEIRLFNTRVWIWERGCSLSAKLDLQYCTAIHEYISSMECYGSGEAEAPGGGRERFRLVLSARCNLYRTFFALYKNSGERISVQDSCLYFQSHCIDEKNLANYAVNTPQEVCYVSQAYFEYLLDISNLDSSVQVFSPIGMGGSHIEFFGMAETGWIENSSGKIMPVSGDELICELINCRAGSLRAAIQRKLTKMFAGDTPYDFVSIDMRECAISLRFRRQEYGREQRYILESVYFSYDMSVRPGFYSALQGDWIIEGYLTEYNLKNRDLDNFEMAANLRGGNLTKLLPEQYADEKLARYMRGILAQFSGSDRRFTAESCFPLGQPMEEPETVLEDWSEGFGGLSELLPSFEAASANAHLGQARSNLALRVSYFKLEGSLEEQSLTVFLTVDTGAVLHFSIGELAATVRELTGYINYTPQNTGIGISGTLRMGFTKEKTFDLFLGGSYESAGGQKGAWTFEAALAAGVISLTDLINALMGWHASFDLEVTAFRVLYSTRGTYAVRCAVATRFPLFGGTMEIAVSAEVTKALPDQSAEVTLTGQVEIQYFLFAVTVELHADSGKAYRFLLQLNELLVTAAYEVRENPIPAVALAEQKGGVLIVTLKNFTIGALIGALFAVLRPNETFALPRPWDILNRIGFPELRILYHVDTKDIEVTLPINIDLLVIQIEEAGFTYQNREGGGEEKFNILIRYRWLLPFANAKGALQENASEYYLWDAFHEAAPSPTAESSRKKFDLKYFGIGRHIDLGLSDVKDMPLNGILDVCREHVKEEKAVPRNKYNGDYGWYVGAQFTLLEFLDVSLLFYDPVIYGLQAVVLNNDVVPLKGLDIMIYYRKVTEDVGLFYVNAGLPDCIRHMEFGMLSITLPSIEVWIYTNGNFKVNFGFPDNMDFSRCFALSYGIFYGRGGFYFGYLNGDTSANVPATTSGYFDPVIELGIGITIGVGKSFCLGILKLRAQLELTGVFTGVFAKFHTPDETVTETYYRCSGTVIIAGEISGEVNFLIIQAGFRIYARAALSAVLESGEATVLAIEASFEVSAYVKIWIFKISFAFSYTYRDTFVLGQAEDKPWKISAAARSALDACAYDWTPRAVYEKKQEIHAYLTPYYSKDGMQCAWGMQRTAVVMPEGLWSGSGAETEKIAVLAATPEEEFGVLVRLLASYVIGAQKRQDEETICAEEARELLEKLGEDCPAFSLETIYELFDRNLVFAFAAAPCSLHDESEKRRALFGEAAEKTTVPMPFVPVYRVTWGTRRDEEGTFDEINYDLKTMEEACRIFEEFVQLVARNALQKAVEYLDRCKAAAVGELLAYLDGQTAQIGGMASRFLLHGNRREGRPLYDVIGQQFAGIAKGRFSEETIVHRLTLAAEERVSWLLTDQMELAIADGDLNYPKGTLFICFGREPAKLPADRLEPVVLSLHDCQTVYKEDKPDFFLWKMPAGLKDLSDFTIHAWPAGSLPDTDTPALDYSCAALLDLTLRKGGKEDVYSIINASEETRAFLKAYERGADQTKITGVHLLFGGEIKKSGEERPRGAFYADEDRKEDTWLIRRNLSETTTAPVTVRAGGEEETACVSLGAENANAFFGLLNKMLAIGGEGHYMRIGGAHLASELFEDDGQTTLYILVQLTTPVCANRIMLSAELDRSAVPVVKSDALGMQCLSVLKPGKIGFEMTTAAVEESAQAYTLLYYVLDGEESLPISMQNDGSAAEGENYYSHIMDIPRYPSLVREIEGTADPYAGILPKGYAKEQKVMRKALPIAFYFADITGNSIGEPYGYEPREPITLAYTDAVRSVSELPMTQVSYRIERGAAPDLFLLRLTVSCEQGEPVEGLMACCARLNAEGLKEDSLINLEQYAFAYYQYAQPDIAFSVEVKIGELYVKSAAWSSAQKDLLVGYLYALYAYAKDIREGRKSPAAPAATLEFVFDKGDIAARTTELSIGKISVTVTAKRDWRYVEESGRLPHMDAASGEAGADLDMDAFCLAFERAFAGSKLLVGDGLYAAFFPAHALAIRPQEPSRIFYALLPFATKLLSRSGMNLTRLSERLDEKDTPHVTSYLNIDIEVWIREFLDFFERILRPANLDYLISFGKRAGETINELLRTKRGLAEVLAARTRSLFAEGESIRPAAEESLREKMCKNLSAGYEAAGTAAYRQSEKLGRFALAGELYNAAGLESAKVFPGRTDICFLTAPEDVASSGTLSMENAALRFTHLEDQSTGEWYRFVEPFEQMPGFVAADIGHYEDGSPVVLPIPLRKYPTEPVLIDQSAKGVCKSPGDFRWSYAFTLSAALSAQDYVHLVLSLGQEGLQMRRADERDLFANLAQFIYDEEEYGEFLIRPVKIDENDVRYEQENLTETPPARVLAALEDFKDLAEEIRRKCVSPEPLAAWRPEFEFVFRCAFEAQRMSKIYVSTEDGKYPNDFPYPVLTIADKDGHSAELTLSEETMSYTIPEEIVIMSEESTAYGFRLDQIPLARCQGLLSEVYLKRNERFENLPAGRGQPEVDWGFLYETDRTGFAHPAQPCIRMTEEYAAGRFTVAAAKELLEKFLYPNTGIQTELTAWLGQRMQGDHVAYRPIIKQIRHILSGITLQEFLERTSGALPSKILEEKDKYFVRFTVLQFAGGSVGADEALLVEADKIVFYL